MENQPKQRWHRGDSSDALDALTELNPTWDFHPHVLLVHWEVYARTRQWKAAYAISLAVMAALPQEPLGWIYRSFALHEMGQGREALIALLPAARQFPDDWRIAYNIACYSSEQGDVAGAWNWLDRAIELGDPDTIKSMALEDSKMKPLWARLGQI